MIQLRIVTIEGVKFSGKVGQVTLPTGAGEITVLPNHIPLISQLNAGTLRTKGGEEGEQAFIIGKGVLEVRKGSNVVVLTDECKSSSPSTSSG
ncbi:MAG: F0F1 ATP synthase subunit epsilon [bacterium]|nr:F0F1 ATP synthase subunit epsilon [bacterium]